METVTIKTAIDSGKKYKDKTIVNIELSDGRKGAGFDDKFLSLSGKTIELEVKEGKEYNGQKQFVFNLPQEKKNAGFRPPVADKKTIALQCAAQVFYGSGDVDSTIKCAEKFHAFLNS